MKCRSDQEFDAGLCYDSCGKGHYGVGPVCWSECPSHSPVTCGAICTQDSKQCIEITKALFSAGINIGINAVTVEGVTIGDVKDQVEGLIGQIPSKILNDN